MVTQRPGQLSLYFHVPFCTKKCDYCHFFVLPDKDPFKKQLIEGFHLELQYWKEEISTSQICSVYFGGGTPALLGAEAIHDVLSHIRQYTPLQPEVEITLEANPENISIKLMQSYAEVGINRISVGIQTFDDNLLKKLGRIHSAQRAIESIQEVAAAGITNLSIDLMYDLPEQSLFSWEKTLSQAVQLPITHLSLYNLTIEPQTVFFKYREHLQKLLPDEDVSLQMYETARSVLPTHGLKQYEISAFAQERYFSRHNTGYWTGRPFLGLGPSAFSYWKGQRFKNVSNLNQYHKKLLAHLSPIDFTEQLEPSAMQRELLAIHLRLMEGVNLRDFEERYGCLNCDTHFKLNTLLTQGFLEKMENNICLTRQGILFYDSLAAEII